MIDNPSNYPEVGKIDMWKSRYVKAAIIVPNDYVGAIMELCQNKRGDFVNMEYLDTNRVTLPTTCRCLKSCMISSIS